MPSSTSPNASSASKAAPPEGRYEPPAPVTDGLQANLINRRHLHRLLAQLESREGPRMRLREARREPSRYIAAVSTPKSRRRRQLHEREHTIQGRKQLVGLRELTDRLLMAATSPALDDEPLELLVGTVDGQPRAYALPLPSGES